MAHIPSVGALEVPASAGALSGCGVLGPILPSHAGKARVGVETAPTAALAGFAEVQTLIELLLGLAPAGVGAALLG